MEIDGERLLSLADGRVLRLEDGKEVADGMGFVAHGKPATRSRKPGWAKRTAEDVAPPAGSR